MEKSDRMSSRDIGEVARVIGNSTTWYRMIGDNEMAEKLSRNLKEMVFTRSWSKE